MGLWYLSAADFGDSKPKAGGAKMQHRCEEMEVVKILVEKVKNSGLKSLCK